MKKHILNTLTTCLLMAGVAQAAVVDLDLPFLGDYPDADATVITTSTSFGTATFDLNYTIGATAIGANPFASSNRTAEVPGQVGVGSDTDIVQHYTTLEGIDGEGLSFTGLSLSNFVANDSGLTLADFDDLTFSGLTLTAVANNQDGANISFTSFGDAGAANQNLNGASTGGTPFDLDLTGLGNYVGQETNLYIETDNAAGSNRWAVSGIQASHNIPPPAPERFARIDLDGSDNSVINGSFEAVVEEVGGNPAIGGAVLGSSTSLDNNDVNPLTVTQWAPYDDADPNDVIGRYGQAGSITTDSFYLDTNSSIAAPTDGSREITMNSVDGYQHGMVNEDFLSELDPNFINANATYEITIDLTIRNLAAAGNATATTTFAVTDSDTDPSDLSNAITDGIASVDQSTLPLGATPEALTLTLSGAQLLAATQLNLVIETVNTGEVTLPETNPGKDVANISQMSYDNIVISAYLPGDTDGDFDVDEDDYLAWKAGFGSAEPDFTDGDFNDDGSVDAADYTVWRDNFTGSLGAANSGGVPEPTTLLLALVCSSWALATRRRSVFTQAVA